MKRYLLLFVWIGWTVGANAQAYNSYEKPINLKLYAAALEDSVSLEITLPKGGKNQKSENYPVLYLLDKQLEANYQYNLYTIDYLTTLQSMPKSVIVGISFSRYNRNKWTNPNANGGKADDLISFLTGELNEVLKKEYAASDFNLLIGHSRTAIFSSYALSKRPDFFNGTIASSVADFDFGDAGQKKQFEEFLSVIPSASHQYYYYFSVGEEAYGDLHEEAVDTLNAFLLSQELPSNLVWNYYKHKIGHSATPGLTVGRALNEIFKEYGKRVDVCFEIANAHTQEVPWDEYLGLYAEISKDLGVEVKPAELFYNSIASHYYNDYDGIYGDQKLDFCLSILLSAIERYPLEIGFYTWIGEIYMSQNDQKKGNEYLDKALKLLEANDTMSDDERSYYVEEIEALKGME